MGLMQLSVGVSVTDLVILATVTLIEMPLHPSVDPYVKFPVLMFSP
jgi:hypothetical protein